MGAEYGTGDPIISTWLDLDSGHRIQLTPADSTGVRHFVDEHKRPDGGACAGAGRVISPGQTRPNDGRAYWVLESESPLTLSPSLLCTQCGDHGFVRGGRWVPA